MRYSITRVYMRKIDNPFTFTTGTIGYPIFFVLTIWLVYWFEIRFSVIFNSWGVYPRTVEGLKGIIFSPFIHGSVKHLFNNSIPLLVLTTALFYFYKKDSWRVLFFGVLLTGIITWSIGRPAYHIGASGIVYMLVAFLFFKGVLSKYYRLIALSLIIVFLYGGLLWYVFPIEEGISWEGHLAGLITGFLFAFLFKTKIEKPKIYAWEQEDYKEEEDAFMKQFDENGNFIELPKEEQVPNEIINETNSKIVIKYTYKSKEDL
jgi:membrane associated rhomboid family serine protease